MYNIAYCVNFAAMDREDRSTKNYERRLEYALWGFRNLKFKILPGINVINVTPNAALLAAMPADYVYYTKISIDVNGCSYTLTVNNRIPIPQRHCGIEVADICACNSGNMPGLSDFGGVYYGYVPSYRAGQYVAEQYSLGGGWNTAGYFREDETNRQFVFKGIPPGFPITIEYVSDGSAGADQIITAPAVVPIRNFIHWQEKLHSYGKNKVSDNDIQEAKNDWLVSKQELRNITNTPTVDDFIDTLFAGFQSSPKGIAI